MPEMHYNAFLSSAPPTVKQMAMQYAEFTLEFTCNHPFAYETATEVRFENKPGDPIMLETDGTVSTPVRLIIKNTGSKPIKNLVIRQNFIE